MNTILWITTVVLVIKATQSYVLLTANLDDVQSIAKQMLQSPLTDQLKRIWRRATNQFNQQMGRSRSRMHQRAEEEEDNNSEENPPRSDYEAQAEGSDNSVEHIDSRRVGADASDVTDKGKETGSQTSDSSVEKIDTRRMGADAAELAEMGKNASFYLNSIKKVMEKI